MALVAGGIAGGFLTFGLDYVRLSLSSYLAILAHPCEAKDRLHIRQADCLRIACQRDYLPHGSPAFIAR